MQLWCNASVVNSLEEQNGNHSSKSKCTIDCAEMRSRVGLAAALAGGVVALLTRVNDLALAGEGALDGPVVLEGLIEVAGRSDIVGRLKVEGTFDIVDHRCFNRRKVAAHIKSTSNLLQLRETINLHQSGVVGNDDVGFNLGQLRECDVIDFIVADDSNSSSNSSKVGKTDCLEVAVVKAKRAVECLESLKRDVATITEGQVSSPGKAR